MEIFLLKFINKCRISGINYILYVLIATSTSGVRLKRIVNPKPGPTKLPTSQADVDRFLARKFNITKFLFDQQLAFIEDPAPFKVAVCSRRAGKTTACAAHLISTAISNPDSNSLYITITKDMVKRNLWKELRRINNTNDLGGIENVSEMTMTFPNGATVYTSGCNDRAEVEKFRGMHMKLCYIDECQSFRAYIKELIDDVIGPALIDYAGSLCLIGTPGPIPVGYFHDCAVKSKDDEWSKHAWTFWDNPHIAITSKMTHQKVFEREIKRRGLGINDPSVKREWYGKWEQDSESLLIRYDANKNHYNELRPGVKYNYIMGIDVGFKDADAISIIAWSENDDTTYLVEEKIETKQGLTELVEQIKALDKKYHCGYMVMDFGGLGLKMGEEIIRQHQIPVEAADKIKKMENIEFLNDALRTGKFKAKADSRFAQDSYLVEIDRDKSTPERIKVSDRFHSDIIDSVLYAFKKSYAFTYKPPASAKPHWGTKEWMEQQPTEMWEAEMAGHQAEVDFNKKLYGEDN